jgi:hypothetical protein
LRRGTLSWARSLHKQHQQQHFYTTQQVLEWRKAAPGAKTLYDGTNEKENCGVGLIASLKSTPSRKLVDQADEMLVRMAHRGGCGCDPMSGDGSGESSCVFQ